MPGDDLFEVLTHVAQQHPLPALVFATAYDRGSTTTATRPGKATARIHAGGKTYLVYRTLNDLEMRLDATQFLRIHRSAIVRLDVTRCEPQSRGRPQRPDPVVASSIL